MLIWVMFLFMQGSFGTLLGSAFHCVYDVQGPVTIHIAVDHNSDWQSFNHEKVNYIIDSLSNLNTRFSVTLCSIEMLKEIWYETCIVAA